MTRALGRLRRLAGGLLVELYPEGWRLRYATEIRALMDDDPPSLRSLGTLLTGAVDAHLDSRSAWRSRVSAAERMRLSVGGLFSCWIAVTLAGAAFQRETEDPPFVAAAERHLILGLAHDAIVLGAGAGAAAIAVGGLPLLWQAGRQALRSRDLRLGALIAIPPASIAAFSAVLLVLGTLGPVQSGHLGDGTRLALLALVWALGGACMLVCAVVPRLVLRRTVLPRRSLRRATLAGSMLTVAMIVVTLALAIYAVGLAVLNPALSGQSGGPPFPSTGLVLVSATLLAALTSALALLCAMRGLRAQSQARRELSA